MKSLIFIVLFSSLVGCNINDDGVLKEGTLINYHSINIYDGFTSFIFNTNQNVIAIIDENPIRVSVWNIKYIDENYKMGSCKYYTPFYSGSLKINEHIKCMDDIELKFN